MDEHPKPTIESAQADPFERDPDTEAADSDQPIEYIMVVRATRTWVQYGVFGFAILCIVIGAVEALFGR